MSDLAKCGWRHLFTRCRPCSLQGIKADDLGLSYIVNFVLCVRILYFVFAFWGLGALISWKEPLCLGVPCKGQLDPWKLHQTQLDSAATQPSCTLRPVLTLALYQNQRLDMFCVSCQMKNYTWAHPLKVLWCWYLRQTASFRVRGLAQLKSFAKGPIFLTGHKRRCPWKWMMQSAKDAKVWQLQHIKLQKVHSTGTSRCLPVILIYLVYNGTRHYSSKVHLVSLCKAT